MRSFGKFLLALLLATPEVAFGAGYELLEQSAEGLGQAFSGATTGSFQDASAAYYNPGALTRLSTTTASVGSHLISPHAEFENEGSRYVPQLGGRPLSGNNGGDGGEFAAVGNLYGAIPLGTNAVFGLGITSPFGLRTDYNETWVGRYHAVESNLTTVNILPSIGIKLSPQFSIGAGLQTIYGEAKITNAVDFATIALTTPGVPSAALAGLTPGSTDGMARIDGDDWGFGYTVGALFSPTTTTHIGINYRSAVHLDLQGEADFDVPGRLAFLTRSGAFVDTSTRAGVTLPSAVSAGFSTALNEQWTYYADATWTDWSKFEELRVEFGSVQPDAVQEENWEDSWRVATGVSYGCSPSLLLRAGVMYDKTPVPSIALRTPRIPDNDRYWFTLGASYELTPSTRLNAGYAHIFVPEAATALTANTGAVLDGDWSSSVDILSFSLSSSF